MKLESYLVIKKLLNRKGELSSQTMNDITENLSDLQEQVNTYVKKHFNECYYTWDDVDEANQVEREEKEKEKEEMRDLLNEKLTI